jgi:hypothetical protein
MILYHHTLEFHTGFFSGSPCAHHTLEFHQICFRFPRKQNFEPVPPYAQKNPKIHQGEIKDEVDERKALLAEEEERHKQVMADFNQENEGLNAELNRANKMLNE